MRPAPAVALRLGGPIWRLPWRHRHGVDMPRLRALVLRAGDAGVIDKKTVFLSHLHVKTIFLPRQAREKIGKALKKETVLFSQVAALCNRSVSRDRVSMMRFLPLLFAGGERHADFAKTI
jgi:hypothetical protein